MTYLGYASAALIATGVIIPLGVELASLSNFLGYITWCLWLLALAVILWRPANTARPPQPSVGTGPNTPARGRRNCGAAERSTAAAISATASPA